MFGIGLPEMALAIVLLVGSVVLAGRAVVRAGGPDAPPHAREWRAVLGVRLLSLVVGISLAVTTWNLGQSGRGAMLALAVLGLCVLLGTAVGETVVRPPRGDGVRSASLTPRRVRDYLPWTAPLVAVQLGLLVGLMVVTTLTASADDLGRSRALTCAEGGISQAHTPYPGAFYTGPLALVLLLVLGATVLAARRVVERPRGMAASDQGDDALRRNSLDMVVAATGVAIGFPLAGLALTTSASLNALASGRPSCAPGWFTEVGVALLILSLLALGSVAHLLGRLVLVRSPRA